MDLKDFVKETLIQVSSGVKEAQESVRSEGGFVNPAARISSSQTDKSHLTCIEGGQNVFLVYFDVAITVNDETEAGMGAKLKVASFINLGADGKTASSSSATNRISFKVPIALPVDTNSQDKLKESDRKQNETIAAAGRSFNNSSDW